MNERIKEIRKALSLTLEEFGKELGVTRSAIGHIENGIRNITEQMILSICREFNVNENWLRYGEGEMFETSPETELEVFCKEYKLNQKEFLIKQIIILLHQKLTCILQVKLQDFMITV